MKKSVVFAVGLFSLILAVNKVSAFCTIEAVFDLNPLGGAKYSYNGINIPVVSLSGDMGLNIHLVYPLSKEGVDHFGFGIGAFSSMIAPSDVSGDYTNLSMNTHWFKMIGVLTYSMIINCFYLNIDVGAYYAAGDGGSRTVEITDNWYTQLEYDRIKYMTPEQFNPDYGLHFRLGIGFGIPNDEVYYETGIWYPTVVGFSTGISVNISFAELLNLPAEDYNQYWDIGLWMGIPFFLQI